MAAPSPPYVPVVVDDDMTEKNITTQSLHWIGFRQNNQRQSIIDDSLGSFDDIRMLSEKDITAMATEWAGITAQNVRITFGVRRTKLLKGLTHWIQYLYRASAIPQINKLDGNGFRLHLQRSLTRAEIRANIREQTKIAANASSPNPLESKRKWKV